LALKVFSYAHIAPSVKQFHVLVGSARLSASETLGAFFLQRQRRQHCRQLPRIPRRACVRRLTVPVDAQTTVCHANGKCQKFDYLKSRLKSGLFCVVSNSEIGVFEKSFFVIFQKTRLFLFALQPSNSGKLEILESRLF
jgi:hypothetical protein